MDDLYSNSNGVETSSSSIGLNAFSPGNIRTNFDSRVQNRLLTQSFSFSEYKGAITAATFSFRARPIGGSANDNLSLRFLQDDGSIVPGTQAWGSRIGYVSFQPTLTTLLPSSWTLTAQPTLGELFILDLATLPSSSGNINLIDDLNTTGFIDFFLSDDTEVDFVTLKITTVPNSPTLYLLLVGAIVFSMLRIVKNEFV